jgi:hypothetical protein
VEADLEGHRRQNLRIKGNCPVLIINKENIVQRGGKT